MVKLKYQIQRVCWHIKQIMPGEMRYREIHYSQSGEDVCIDRLLKFKNEGFYIDVGCYHPFQYSNTCLFYKKGWSGINIDAKKETIDLFNKYRKRDINLNLGVGAESGELEYFMFKQGAKNTFSAERAKGMIEEKPNEYIGKRIVDIRPLAEILNNYINESQMIDFMDIDVEGLDLEVLKSNDWNKFRPHYVLVETDGIKTVTEVLLEEIVMYMMQCNYSIIGKFGNTLLMKDDLFKE